MIHAKHFTLGSLGLVFTPQRATRPIIVWISSVKITVTRSSTEPWTGGHSSILNEGLLPTLISRCQSIKNGTDREIRTGWMKRECNRRNFHRSFEAAIRTLVNESVGSLFGHELNFESIKLIYWWRRNLGLSGNVLYLRLRLKKFLDPEQTNIDLCFKPHMPTETNIRELVWNQSMPSPCKVILKWEWFIIWSWLSWTRASAALSSPAPSSSASPRPSSTASPSPSSSGWSSRLTWASRCRPTSWPSATSWCSSSPWPWSCHSGKKTHTSWLWSRL